ncbi:50S ribosomal protein L19 [Candidatus Nesciobacter abundans]|uniref:Large ribosomal subunit protein bL19 n=2 Tax=Candidatus Nesciobacter abundans TaxID=2601668 RepID=A0A5C0UIQ8_9PROT|nr:50S ribosomal protein L19 [Candidatus Nesciobacter abundans]
MNKKAAEKLNSDHFEVGDTVSAHIPIDKKRTKAFEGLCIKKTPKTALIRKIVNNRGMECSVPLFGNVRIEKHRSHKVRRAVLFYLRKLTGRKAKLKERFN